MTSRYSSIPASLLTAMGLAAATGAQAIDISETPLCGAGTSIAASSSRLSGTTTFLYQARFAPGDWSGQLLALPIQPDGTVGAPAWDAATLIPAAESRNIHTCDPTAAAGCGKPFQWSQLNPSQRAALNKNAGGTIDNKGPARLAYLRGERANEAPSGEQFRARNVVLGDIVNSDPLFVGRQDFGFDVLPGAEGRSYVAFRKSAAYRSRPGIIYVGANDGMLHAFDAGTGRERFAFVPNTVYSRLSLLTDASYDRNHKYFVDGAPRGVDAYIGGAWQTVLVGALGAGGRGVFGLRITDPAHFDADDVLWEFGDADDADMGFSFPQPSIARMNNGKWAALVANGYNSAGRRAVLFVVDLETGAILSKIDTGVGGDNGLSSPIPVDVDNDRITDFIYAGDLKGNLWKFDVTSKTASRWDVAVKQGNAPKPLFSACATTTATACSSADQQTITARPEVGLNAQGGFVVYFGTGRYLAPGDASVTTPVNSFYGIFDRHDKGTANPQPAGSRSQLLRQEVLGAQTLSGEGFTELVRVTSKHQLTDSHAGWYIDLPEAGERHTTTPLLRGGRVIFTTLTPGADSCPPDGTSWLMELDARNGSAPAFSPFDINRDRRFNVADFASVTIGGQETRAPVSGRRSKEGIIEIPGVITDGEIELKYAGGTTGGVDVTVENSAGTGGRQSWRQLQ